MKLLETLKAEGRIEEARQHGLLQLIEHPQHAELHYEVASLHDMQGRETQAIPLYQKAIALGLSEVSLRGAWLGLGSSYRSTGQYTEALAAFEQRLAQRVQLRQQELASCPLPLKRYVACVLREAQLLTMVP